MPTYRCWLHVDNEALYEVTASTPEEAEAKVYELYEAGVPGKHYFISEDPDAEVYVGTIEEMAEDEHRR